MTANIDTLAQFIDELEKFESVFRYHMRQAEAGSPDKGIADGLRLRADILHRRAVVLLPDGSIKEQILRWLAWCHYDADLAVSRAVA
jgi:hypothetical protein